MYSLISLFVCLAMLVSGASFADDPNAAAAHTAVISDIVLTIEGETHTIDPDIVLGVQTADNSALFDFGIVSDDEVLFPIQVKMDEAGLALQLDDSSAYVLPIELLNDAMGEDAVPGELMENYVSSYTNLIGAAAALETPGYTAEIAQKQTEILNGIIGDVPTEETTVNITGVEEPATTRAYTLTMDQMAQLIDEALLLMPESYKAAYDEYWTAYSALAASFGVEIPSTLSVSDMLAEYPMDITMDITETLNADGAGYISAVVTETITEGEESYTFQFPMEIAVYDEDTMNLVIETALEEDDFDPLNIMVEINVDGAYVDMSMVMGDEIDTIAVYGAVYQDDDMDGDVNFVLAYDINVGGTSVTLNFNNEGPGGNFAFDMDGLYGLSFHIDTNHDPIEDRVSTAKQVVFESMEDENAINGLSMAFMGLMGDVEKLMNEDSVAALVAAIDAMNTAEEASSIAVIGGADGPTSVFIVEGEATTEESVAEVESGSND